MRLVEGETLAARIARLPVPDSTELALRLNWIEGLELTRTGESFGTVAYMCPEQLRGERVDRRCDTWGLAVTAYEAVVGERPFRGTTMASLSTDVLEREPPILRRQGLAIGRDVDVVIRAALDRDPTTRLASAAELADELARIRRGEPIRSRPTPRRVRVVRWARRNPGVAASLTVTLITLLIGLALSLAAWDRERGLREQRDGALRDFSRMNDLALARSLIERETRLWPVRGAIADPLDDWLQQARALLARRADHLDTVGALAAQAAPWSPEQRSRDAVAARQGDPGGFARLDARRQELEVMRKGMEQATTDAQRTTRRDVVERLVRVVAEMEERLGPNARRSWDFGSNFEVAFQHETYRKLIAAEAVLIECMPRVEARAATALALARSDQAVQHAWQQCLTDLRRASGFARVDAPVGNLVPLGRDKDSGLWEFWLVGSGPRPKWTGVFDAGHVSLEADFGVVLVLLPGGRFTMGAQAADRNAPGYDARAQPIEGPVSDVALDPFWISKYELTQAQWLCLFGRNPSEYNAGLTRRNPVTLAHPVTDVSWHDAFEGARRLGLELPTEEQ